MQKSSGLNENGHFVKYTHTMKKTNNFLYALSQQTTKILISIIFLSFQN